MRLSVHTMARYLAYSNGWNARHSGSSMLENPYNKTLARVLWKAWMEGYSARDSGGLSVSIPLNRGRFKIGKNPQSKSARSSRIGTLESAGNEAREVHATGPAARESRSEGPGQRSEAGSVQAIGTARARRGQLSLFEDGRVEGPS